MKSFIKTSILGGIVVLLPVGIVVLTFNWLFGMVRSAIKPFTDQLVARQMGEMLAVVVVLAIIIAICFTVGVIIRTQFGRFIHNTVEAKLLRIVPGYNVIKETVLQFLGDKPSPFASVALVRIFGNETLVTAFVTECHPNGWFTVFVPTGPNPTSGNIYHLKPEYVHPIQQPVEDVMRSIISCGAGSEVLLANHLRNLAAPPPGENVV